MTRKTVHGTCVALGDAAALLRGASGAGKSDLALRFLHLNCGHQSAQPVLIADDRVILTRRDDHVVASCPPILTGNIEVRGLGIVQVRSVAAEAALKLIIDLETGTPLPRFPEKAQWETVRGVTIRRITLDPFELSAPIKLALAIEHCCKGTVD